MLGKAKAGSDGIEAGESQAEPDAGRGRKGSAEGWELLRLISCQ